MNALSLPPPFRAVRVEGAITVPAAAREAAAGGAEGGTMLWCERPDRLDFALVLRPDRSRQDTLPVIYLGGLAVADALAAFAAPATLIGFRWPGEILIDGGFAGRLSLGCATSAADAVPDWAVLGLQLALAGSRREPGLTPYVTTIADEGFDEISAGELVESFARHLLRWIDRWTTDGLAPIAAAWWQRADGFVRQPAILLADGAARPLGLGPTGDLRVSYGGCERILPLEAALAEVGDG
jgi:BirA family transcriptional regulator, biotin operon repressor / biotin---[acetyl-CoA-carboxylase] ligase